MPHFSVICNLIIFVNGGKRLWVYSFNDNFRSKYFETFTFRTLIGIQEYLPLIVPIHDSILFCTARQNNVILPISLLHGAPMLGP